MYLFTVFLIDANEQFRRIASYLLREYYNETLCLVGISSADADALDQVRQLKPHIVLLGIGQYSLAELELITPIRAMLPNPTIIVLGGLDIPAYRQLALKSGADEFVAKDRLNDVLLPTIEKITGTRTQYNGWSYEPESELADVALCRPIPVSGLLLQTHS